MTLTRFKVLVADPPWLFKDKLPGKTRGAVKNYRCMTVDEIRRFPIPTMDRDSVLLLWRVGSMQEEALSVARAWGFTVKSEIVWVKTTVSGAYYFGMGRYVRNCHETCLIAARGRATRVVADHATRSIFLAPRPKLHSAKPPEFYALAEKLFAGPRVEIFARARRPGWIQYGDQLGEES